MMMVIMMAKRMTTVVRKLIERRDGKEKNRDCKLERLKGRWMDGWMGDKESGRVV